MNLSKFIFIFIIVVRQKKNLSELKRKLYY